MSNVISIVITVTFILTAVSISLIAYKVKKRDQGILKSLLLVIIFLNSIWYSVLILQLWNSDTFILDNSIGNMGLEILFFSLLFITRFLFLIAFINLLIKILDFKISRSLSMIFKVSVIVIIGIWILGWLELLVLDSQGIISNIMIYTDILIIFIIIIGSVYLSFQSKLIQDKQSQKAIKMLGMVFIVPMVLGFVKWLLSGSFGIENKIWERLSLHFLVVLINVLFIWWLIIYGNKVSGIPIIKSGETKTDPDGLMLKYNISKREMEVIRLICDGCTNKEIANNLFISIDTVKDHNSRIFLKTNIKNRTQLAKLFLS